MGIINQFNIKRIRRVRRNCNKKSKIGICKWYRRAKQVSYFTVERINSKSSQRISIKNEKTK